MVSRTVKLLKDFPSYGGIALFCFSLLILSSQRGLGQGKKSNAILVTIDGTAVVKNEFVRLYQKNHAQQGQAYQASDIEEYFDRFIHFKLKVREAENRGMARDPDFYNELSTYKETLKKPYIAEANTLDSLTKLTYERLKEELKAAHILIALKPDAPPEDTLKAYRKAMMIRDKLTAGASFDQMAREFSEDPSAKINGGSLGYFTALQMVFPFEDAAYKLNEQEISHPVRSQDGYHLIKVEDRRLARGEREVSHLMVRGEDEKSKKTIAEIYEQAMEGKDWDQLCKTYSQDVATKDKGGRLRPFGPGAMASAPAFEEAAFLLEAPGSISKPVQTPFGWHLIRLERKIFLPPFSEMVEPLKKRVARDERMKISHAREMEKRKRKLGFVEQEHTLGLLKLWAMDSGQYELEGKGDATLFIVNGLPYSASDFFSFVKEGKQNTAGEANSLHQSYARFVEKILVDTEDSLLQVENPEYKSLVEEYREGMLLFSIMEKEVWNRASEDTLGQRQYYKENTDRYQAGQRVKARVFSAEGQSVLDQLQQRLSAGDSISADELARFKSVRAFRTYKKGEMAIIDSVDRTTGLHRTEAGGMYYLVEIKDLLPPGQAGFEEVKAQVISDYQDYLEKQWIGQLKKKYTVSVNTRIKKRMIKELVKNQPRN